MADASVLPDTVRRFLTAHAGHDVEQALGCFTSDGAVTDEATTYRGTEQLRHFLATAGGPYTYTTTFLGAEQDPGGRWIVRQRIDGDFPGGTADLRYGFVLDGDLIGELVIAP